MLSFASRRCWRSTKGGRRLFCLVLVCRCLLFHPAATQFISSVGVKEQLGDPWSSHSTHPERAVSWQPCSSSLSPVISSLPMWTTRICTRRDSPGACFLGSLNMNTVHSGLHAPCNTLTPSCSPTSCGKQIEVCFLLTKGLETSYGLG